MMAAAPAVRSRTSEAGAFPTTQWSMIVHAGGGSDTQAQAALETLCRRYWYPLYFFARRQGRSHHEADAELRHLIAAVSAATSSPRS